MHVRTHIYFLLSAFPLCDNHVHVAAATVVCKGTNGRKHHRHMHVISVNYGKTVFGKGQQQKRRWEGFSMPQWHHCLCVRGGETSAHTRARTQIYTNTHTCTHSRTHAYSVHNTITSGRKRGKFARKSIYTIHYTMYNILWGTSEVERQCRGWMRKWKKK